MSIFCHAPNYYICNSPLSLHFPPLSLSFSAEDKFSVDRRDAMRKPCCDKQGNNKGAWSKQEDQKLMDYIRIHGEGNWTSLPKAAGLHRCGKSCRLRWINYLRPDIKRGNFAHDEEDLIIKLHALLGNRWSLIAGRLPGRTDNEVKNYWNSHLKKKLINMGIDPNNHKPSQTLVRPRAHQNLVSETDTSSGSSSMNVIDACPTEPIKPSENNETNHKISDRANCLENESHNNKLSLDLTISFPSPQEVALLKEEDRTAMERKCREIDSGSSSATLLLFR